MDTNQASLSNLRHSFAHLLAAAVTTLYPKALPTIGPSTDDGFYYDFDFGDTKISESDLKSIEKKMESIVQTWKTFDRREVSADEARKIFADNPYKIELINELEENNKAGVASDATPPQNSGRPQGTPLQPRPKADRPMDDASPHAYTPVTLYTSGTFTDLCRGGHIENPSKGLRHFRLMSIAGAYWRGSEKNKMLTRIYGTAFATKEELDTHLKMLEEAKKRDHKKLGVELDLFTFSPLVGSGLALWTPRGTILRIMLDEYIWKLRSAKGYERVEIPHITKKELYEKSGHWDKFKDELFQMKTREGDIFVMKPMNCPHHTQIFASKPRSYRDMPHRYANTTMVYRDEQSGELSGLSRVRCITQDDAHVFCREDQVKDEILKIWDIVETFYKTFGFELKLRLSFCDPEHPEKYLGDKEVWDRSERLLRDIAVEKNASFEVAPGEAAFYGPKLDFMGSDALGRKHQVATIQLDRSMPSRFGLEYTNTKGVGETPVMIHAAIMGSIERFLSVLIEHYAGAFPLWLSPVQIALLPIGEMHTAYANQVAATLRKHGIRVDVDENAKSIGAKIRHHTLQKVPYMGIIGDKEIESLGVSVRSRDGSDHGITSVEALTQKFVTEIENHT